MIRDRIRVLNPIQLSFAQYGIRVLVQKQEGSYLGNTLLDAPPDLNSALRFKIAGEQNIDILLRPCKQDPLPNTVEWNSALPLVARINVLIALGIVKLLDSGGDNLVPRRNLSEVNLWLGDIQAIFRFGGNILKKILRQPSSGCRRHEVHHQAFAMRELKVLVHPGLRLCGQLRREFPGRKHYLMVAIRQMVSIDIHVIKLVVKTNRLGLLISLKQGP